jgi:hypothetical protein
MLWDLADSRKVRQLLEVFYSNNKPIGATSQGVGLACFRGKITKETFD